MRGTAGAGKIVVSVAVDDLNLLKAAPLVADTTLCISLHEAQGQEPKTTKRH